MGRKKKEAGFSKELLELGGQRNSQEEEFL
jgi:hypothetical protein